MEKRIALLGWGSLLWDEDKNKEFDTWHEPWQCGGLTLKIEFSRISKSRCDALTLVIDPENGVPVPVCWSLSRRSTINEAVEDLRCREGRRIGWWGGGKSRGFDEDSISTIEAWAAEHNLDGVVWTDFLQQFCKQERGTLLGLRRDETPQRSTRRCTEEGV